MWNSEYYITVTLGVYTVARTVKCRRLRWPRHVASVEERNGHSIMFGNLLKEDN
jgi:hypothetical protein